MKRRDLLQFMALAFVQPRLPDELMTALRSSEPKAAKATRKGEVFLFFNDGGSPTSLLRQLDWDRVTYRDVTIPLNLPHSLVQDRNEKHVVYVFENFGSAARIDLKSGRVIKIDHRTAREMSYGHATQVSSGELLCTQLDADTGHAYVSVKTSGDMKTIARLPSECDGSHQIAVLPGSKLAVCGVATDLGRGRKGAVTFVDWEKRKVVQRIETAVSISHVFPISSTEAIALGLDMDADPIKPSYEASSEMNTPDTARKASFHPAPIYFVNTGGVCREIPTAGLREHFKFNFGFLKIPNSNLSVTSHLGSHKVIIWEGTKPVRVHHFPYPMNLVASDDASEFMLVSEGRPRTISLETFDEVPTLESMKLPEGGYRAVGLAGYKS